MTMINLTNIPPLKEIIERQLDLLTQILDIEKSKNIILIQGKLTDFSSMNNQLAELLPEIEKIEQQRQVAIDLFMKDNPNTFSDSSGTFLTILNLLKEESLYDEMFTLYQKTKGTVDDIKHYISINKDLIEVALNVLNLTLHEDKKNIDYTGKTEEQNSSILLNKII